jgi:hypothetical protein
VADGDLMAHIPNPIQKNPVWLDLQCAEQLLRQLYAGKIQALIISGPPGMGKTHLGEKVAREFGQEWNPERPGSFIGLMRIFKQYARGGVLGCDDLDWLWSNSKRWKSSRSSSTPRSVVSSPTV